MSRVVREVGGLKRAREGREVELPPSLKPVAMVDIEVVRATHGLRSVSAVYDWIKVGTMLEPIQLGKKCSRWLITEVEALVAARVRGDSDDELRALVADLRAARQRVGRVAA